MSDEHDGELYHTLSDGTKWPNCIQCHSGDTTIVPASGEWTCQDCGRQWHTDEIDLDAGDGNEIGGQIENMLWALAGGRDE